MNIMKHEGSVLLGGVIGAVAGAATAGILIIKGGFTMQDCKTAEYKPPSQTLPEGQTVPSAVYLNIVKSESARADKVCATKHPVAAAVYPPERAIIALTLVGAVLGALIMRKG